MTQNQPSMVLKLYHPKGEESEIILENKLTIGSDAKNDFQLKHSSIEDYHCILRLKNGVVAIHNLARNHGATKIESFELGQGKMYLLNPGDRIFIGDYQALIPAIVDESIVIKESTAPAIALSLDQENDEIEIGPEFEEEEANEIELDEEIPSDDTDNPDELPEIPQDHSTHADSSTDFNLSGLIVRDDLIVEDEEDEHDDVEDDELSCSDTDQRMLEAIQQGRQPDFEGTQTSFLTRLFRLNRLFNREKEKPRSQLFQRMGLPVPSPLLRIYGLIAEIPLAFSVAFTLFPILNIKAPIKEVLEPISMIIQEAADLSIDKIATINESLYFLTAALILSLISHLALGTSIPLFFMGIKTNDGEITKRWKGVLRSALGALTLPFIIFDLPALFKKPTLKEWILKSRLGIEGNRFLRIFAITIIIPVMMICSFYLPFGIDPDSLAGISVERVTPQALKLQDTQMTKLYLPNLSFSFEGEISKELYFLPFFKMVENKLNPTLMISRMDQEQLVSFNVQDSVDFITIIELIKSNDPLFIFKYPLLASSTSESANWTQEEMEELANLIEESFALTPENLHEYIFNNGPFITGTLLVRKELLQKFGPWENAAASIIRGRHQLILEIKDTTSSRYINNYYLPLNLKKSTIYKLNFAEDSKKLAAQVERSIIYPARFIERDKVDPQQLGSNPFFIFNIFNQKDLMKSAEGRDLMIGLYQQWDSRKREDLTKKSILSLIKAIKSKYKGDETDFSPLFDSLEKIIQEMTPAQGNDALDSSKE